MMGNKHQGKRYSSGGLVEARGKCYFGWRRLGHGRKEHKRVGGVVELWV